MQSGLGVKISVNRINIVIPNFSLGGFVMSVGKNFVENKDVGGEALPYYLTLGKIGYIRGGGTIASLIAWPVAVLLSFLPEKIWRFLVYFLNAAGLVLTEYHVDFDDRRVVVDEFCAVVTLLSFYIRASSDRREFWIRVLKSGLILVIYRFFDSFKVPFVVHESERLPGALGIFADDFVACFLAIEFGENLLDGMNDVVYEIKRIVTGDYTM